MRPRVGVRRPVVVANGWRRSIVVIGVLLVTLPAARAQGVDFMVMVQAYGDAVFGTLHTEIMNSAMGVPGGASQPPRVTTWPEHLGVTSVDGHVFSVDELIAMRYADPGRMRELLHGRAITVQGVVERSVRADSSFRLVSATDEGYGVWAYWRRVDRPLPEHGSTVTLHGVAELERQGYLTMREAEYVDGQAVGGPSALDAVAIPDTPDYAALTFAPWPEVTAALAESMADTLSASLAEGHGRQDLVDLIRSGELQTVFAQLLEPYGFSGSDMADVLASHLIMSWQIANDHPEDGPRQGVLAVRDEMRESLARAAWLPGLLDAEKQAFSETLVVGTMLIVARYFRGKETGDQTVVAMAAQDARDMVLGYGGPDLRGLVLTGAGLVAR